MTEEMIKLVCDVLDQNAKVFRLYERLHTEKGDDKKARKNGAMARLNEELLGWVLGVDPTTDSLTIQ